MASLYTLHDVCLSIQHICEYIKHFLSTKGDLWPHDCVTWKPIKQLYWRLIGQFVGIVTGLYWCSSFSVMNRTDDAEHCTFRQRHINYNSLFQRIPKKNPFLFKGHNSVKNIYKTYNLLNMHKNYSTWWTNQSCNISFKLR